MLQSVCEINQTRGKITGKLSSALMELHVGICSPFDPCHDYILKVPVAVEKHRAINVLCRLGEKLRRVKNLNFNIKCVNDCYVKAV